MAVVAAVVDNALQIEYTWVVFMFLQLGNHLAIVRVGVVYELIDNLVQ